MDVRTNLRAGQLGPGQILKLLSIAQSIDPQQLAALQQVVGQLSPKQVSDLMGIACSIDPQELPGLLKAAGAA